MSTCRNRQINCSRENRVELVELENNELRLKLKGDLKGPIIILFKESLNNR